LVTVDGKSMLEEVTLAASPPSLEKLSVLIIQLQVRRPVEVDFFR